MAENKTIKTKESVTAFLNGIESEQQKSDCIKLNKLFTKVTKKKAVLWVNGMVGYGTFHYKSEKSAQEGDWSLTGFSPRKKNITIYIMPGVNKYASLLKKLGKHKTSSGSCLFINKLDDIDTEILEELIAVSVSDMKKKYNVK